MSQQVCQAYHPSIFDEEADIPTLTYQRNALIPKVKKRFDMFAILYGLAVGIFGSLLLLIGVILYRIMFG